MAYQPIEDYGIIGNMHTAALVGMNGSIDWFCHPRFDSPSVFAAILDDEKGGRFRISPLRQDVTQRQFYWPETNVLVTRFLSPDGVGQVLDFMPVGVAPHRRGHHWLIRRVEVARGSMEFEMDCSPAFNYGRDEHETVLGQDAAYFESPGCTLALLTQADLQRTDSGVVSRFTLDEDDSVTFVLRGVHDDENEGEPCPPEEVVFELFRHTVDYWRHWVARSTYTGRWRETVHRSALALKLMTYEPSGAILAAPTASLPESVGGDRNWDYRYSWIRDAAFTVYAFLRIGFTEEATNFMGWLEARMHELEPDGSLQVMYGIAGEHELDEVVLDHLEGYRGSGPVRIGNSANKQLQLDIYGELMDSIYLYNKYVTPIAYDLWKHVRKMMGWLCEHWDQKDEGIWEVRSGRQHFVYSKLMCWVALDRALRLADKRSFPAEHDRWLECRDTIYGGIFERGWNAGRQAFVQHYGSESLDAANLIMPLVFFLSPTDPRMLRTIDAVMQSPREGGLLSNSLVYRYDLDASPDGLDSPEGTFNMCTFWLVEALTRAGQVYPDRLDRARLIFEQMLGYANHLGLYAEQTGPSGEALGNFPQAFTHLSLISAAFNLDRALGRKA